MKTSDLVLIIGAIATLLAVIPAFINIFKGTYRKNVESDLAILSALPSNSKIHKTLTEHIEKKIEKLIDSESSLTRNYAEAIAGFAVFVFPAYGSYYFYQKNGGWIIISVALGFIALAGNYGFFQGIKKTHRDEKGNIIDDKKT